MKALDNMSIQALANLQAIKGGNAVPVEEDNGGGTGSSDPKPPQG